MMILSLIFVSSYSEFNPKVTKTMRTNDNLWNVLSSTSSDGDALITVKEGIYSTSQWANIGSFVTGLSVKGTLKIKGEGKVIVDGGFKVGTSGWTKDSQNQNILITKVPTSVQDNGENKVDNWRFEALWVNGHDTRRARIPNGHFQLLNLFQFQIPMTPISSSIQLKFHQKQ